MLAAGLVAVFYPVAGAGSQPAFPIEKGRHHLQLQFGVASDADFGPSLLFLNDQSIEHTYLTGFNYGRLVGTQVFGKQAEVIAYVGLQNYLERSLQPNSYGLTLYYKVYKWWSPQWLPESLPVRFGLGQGLSYTSRIPVSEQRDFEPRRSAKLVHYLEWSVQLPLSGLMGLAGIDDRGGLQNIWVGYNIFHRSTVYGLFAESAGGINYPGVSFEYSFR